MKTSGRVLVVVTGLAIFGCAQMNPRSGLMRPEKAECKNGNNCDVIVTVNCKGSAPCWLTVNPELILLRKTISNDKITWKLDASSDFKFDSPGISFDDPSAFRCEGNGPRQRHCFSLKPGTEAYKYDIRVLSDSGQRVDPYDPWVVVN